uniref:Uncharacterized protein n=1 Tax=Arundo donax TaxID=35708 RepID=A0A0A9AUM5_ARUDO
MESLTNTTPYFYTLGIVELISLFSLWFVRLVGIYPLFVIQHGYT